MVVIELPGWPALNNRATRAGAEATGSVELLGIDTTDTVLFPGTSGAGVLRKAGAFVDLDQQGDPTTAGGEQQYWSGTLLEDRPVARCRCRPSRTPRPSPCRCSTIRRSRGIRH
jgi:hypothetical protein